MSSDEKDKENVANSENVGNNGGESAGAGLERDADFSKLTEEATSHANEDGEAGSTLSAPEINREVEMLKAEIEALKDKNLRTLADFDNFRKRSMKERSELLKYQGEKILLDMLEVADNFERALAQAKTDPDSLKEGLPLIYKLLMDSFNRWEVKAESGIGKPFNPAKYVALSRVTVDDAPPGTIINEMRKTYFYKDKLLRAGEVIVAAPREAPEASAKVAEEGEETKE